MNSRFKESSIFALLQSILMYLIHLIIDPGVYHMDIYCQ